MTKFNARDTGPTERKVVKSQPVGGFRAPVAEKLAELREKTGRIKPHKTPRKGFTEKQRRDVAGAFDGLCAKCATQLQKGFHIDHIVELDDEGAHEPSNWQPLCPPCHRKKTSAWRTRSAKADRCRKRDEELPEPSRIRSNPKIAERAAPWPPKQQPVAKRPFPGGRKERA